MRLPHLRGQFGLVMLGPFKMVYVSAAGGFVAASVEETLFRIRRIQQSNSVTMFSSTSQRLRVVSCYYAY